MALNLDNTRLLKKYHQKFSYCRAKTSNLEQKLNYLDQKYDYSCADLQVLINTNRLFSMTSRNEVNLLSHLPNKTVINPPRNNA
jgi:hypothetical protein